MQKQNQSIGKYTSSIYRYQSIIINKMFEQYGIGSGQYIFLINISNNPGINQKDLSRRVKIDRANTHRAIKKLESLGYIYTKRCESDKRIIKSYLTDEGEALMPKIKSGLINMTEIMTQGFSAAEREAAFNFLGRIEENVSGYVKSLREGQKNDKEKQS